MRFGLSRAITQRSLKFMQTILKGLLPFLALLGVGMASKPTIKTEWELGCQLGEGAFWDESRQRLWFVDIENGRIHWFDPASSSKGSFDCGQRIGTLVPARDKDELVLGLQSGIFRYQIQNQKLSPLVKPDLLDASQRLNDGKCDPAGRFWVGSMNLDQSPKKAHLFCLEGKSLRKVLDSISISNGIAWTQNQKTMFYIDTPTRTVKAFDFDASTGTLSNGRILLTVQEKLGWPDGMCLDENDDLWIGMWGGACVSHWSGKDGRLLGTLPVPALNVTSCAFGGPNRDVLYITTAKAGMKEEELRKYPQSGHLFSAKPGVRGPQMAYWKSSE